MAQLKATTISGNLTVSDEIFSSSCIVINKAGYDAKKVVESISYTESIVPPVTGSYSITINVTNMYESIVSPGSTMMLKSRVEFNGSLTTNSGTFSVASGTTYICAGVTTHTYTMNLTAGTTYTATVTSLSGAEVSISSISISR